MTREEAIKIIDVGKNFAYDEKYIEAFDMAIKALEQEPTTKNDLGVDCISREAVQNILPKMAFTSSQKYMQALSELELLPSVYPKIDKHSGKWIKNAPQYDMLNPQYICSECGNAHIRITPYCEMCGSKMESEDKADE